MSFSDDEDERRCDEALVAMRDRLVDEGRARRVRSAEDGRYFVAAGMASVVAHRFGDTLDPETLSGDALHGWMERATAEGESWGDPRGRRGALLLLDRARRIGTLEVEWMSISRCAWVTNLYVVPDMRGRGIASALLDRVHDALAPAGAWGVSLSTHWAWQPTVAFYLRHGATVRSWEHALTFVWRRPGESWSIAIEGDDACFRFRADDGHETVWRASREDGWLRWDPPIGSLAPGPSVHAPRDRAVPARASTPAVDPPPRERRVLDDDRERAERTFALALAVRGWPLARSSEALGGAIDRASDKDPEALAAKIERWEAWDRAHGFVVRTPRLPGIAYRDHDVLVEP